MTAAAATIRLPIKARCPFVRPLVIDCAGIAMGWMSRRRSTQNAATWRQVWNWRCMRRRLVPLSRLAGSSNYLYDRSTTCFYLSYCEHLHLLTFFLHKTTTLRIVNIQQIIAVSMQYRVNCAGYQQNTNTKAAVRKSTLQLWC